MAQKHEETARQRASLSRGREGNKEWEERKGGRREVRTRRKISERNQDNKQKLEKRKE